MNADWRRVLEGFGARIVNDHVLAYGDPKGELAAALNGDVIVDLSPLALIEVAGEDAQGFLAAQLTSDVRALTADRSELSAWCSPQGRVLALLRIYRTADAFFLLLPSDLAESTLKRLRMYTLRSRVTISDRSDELLRVGVSGEAARTTVADTTDLPDRPDQVTHGDGLTVIRLPDRRPRVLLVGRLDLLATFWTHSAASLRPASSTAWDLLNIEAAQPQVFTETRDKFLPQMLNLDLLGGLSFSKGCYPGQEVIARLKYRAQLKQRLYIGRADTGEVPAPGTRLAVQGSDMSAGEIVMAAPHPEGGVMCTAVVQIELATTNRVHVGSHSGPLIRFSPPPYNVT